MNVRLLCDSGHSNRWSSSGSVQHKTKKVYTLNLKMVVYLFLGGLRFQVFKVRHFYFVMRTYVGLSWGFETLLRFKSKSFNYEPKDNF